jgi:predicted glycosyltransferase involved in capsule biosynthesis
MRLMRRLSKGVFAPALCSRNIPIICSSLNRLPFVRPSHLHDGRHFISRAFSGFGSWVSNLTIILPNVSERLRHAAHFRTRPRHERCIRYFLAERLSQMRLNKSRKFALKTQCDPDGGSQGWAQFRFLVPSNP